MVLRQRKLLRIQGDRAHNEDCTAHTGATYPICSALIWRIFNLENAIFLALGTIQRTC